MDQTVKMEKEKLLNQGDASTFICSECGDGFTQYQNVLVHMAIHGPLESFCFDGSSNGFEIPREYVLLENGTFKMVNGIEKSYPAKPSSPGVLPSMSSAMVRPGSPTLRPLTPVQIESHKPKPAVTNLDTSRQGQYPCDTCHQSFTSLQNLHSHQLCRNTEQGFRCTLCCKLFAEKWELRNHLECHKRERFHCCNHCGKRFLKVELLNAHEKENHIFCTDLRRFINRGKKCENTYQCRKCKFKFFWISDFHIHSQHHCKGREPETTFTSEIEIELDIDAKSTDGMPFESIHSNGVFLDGIKEDSNVLMENGDSTNKEHPKNPYRCGLCGDRFQRLPDLKEHHLTHQTPEEMDKLNEELSKVKKNISLKARRRRASNPNGRLHPCKQCHRVFHHSSSLSRHMRYHKGTMHTCVFCGRHFPQRCDLKRHLAMYHKGDFEKKTAMKRFGDTPENGCDQSAVNGENIKVPSNENSMCPTETQHIPPEEGESVNQSERSVRKTYNCLDCGKRFRLLCVYHRHLRYHKNHPHKCPRCPARFTHVSSLELHITNHPVTREGSETALGSGSPFADTDLEKAVETEMEDGSTDSSLTDKENSSMVLHEFTG
ncbi:zinc finger protein 569 [Synchiropus splendidus]|uniref:zinc finger protein 569 n=1 Tax=Synchiropus splendidus TaxID=270530 RepID=UPI00237DE3BC|nr:zinc finger protein 569 [Synchiropus splendidus]